MPGVEAAERQSGHQERQRPGVSARELFVDPEPKRRAEQCRHDHRPTDQPHHAEAEPDPRRRVALRLELAGGLGADRCGKVRAGVRGSTDGFVIHVEGS